LTVALLLSGALRWRVRYSAPPLRFMRAARRNINIGDSPALLLLPRGGALARAAARAKHRAASAA
jgi:hypothetical protein